MFNFKGQPGYLRIEHLVGGIGRLVFVPSTVEESTEEKPVPLTCQDFKELNEQQPHYEIHVDVRLEKSFFTRVHKLRSVAIYRICSRMGDSESGVLCLGGGDTPKFTPSTPFLEYTSATGEILIDTTPIRNYAGRYYFGLS